MGSVILGLIIIGVGVLFVIKTESILRNFGRIYFFEKHLGTSGGSRLGYKLLGVLFIFLGLLTTFGLFEGFLSWILAPVLSLQNIN